MKLATFFDSSSSKKMAANLLGGIYGKVNGAMLAARTIVKSALNEQHKKRNDSARLKMRCRIKPQTSMTTETPHTHIPTLLVQFDQLRRLVNISPNRKGMMMPSSVLVYFFYVCSVLSFLASSSLLCSIKKKNLKCVPCFPSAMWVCKCMCAV